ncbi:MAG: hypothetical protein ACE5FG_02850 [Myxococcota bacterium]
MALHSIRIGLGVATTTALLTLGSGTAWASLPSSQQSCVNTINKNLQKVSSKLGKEISSCLKDFAKGKSVTDIPACVAQDRKGKVAKAKNKALAADNSNCIPNPPRLYTGAANANLAATAKEAAVLEILFGSDVNGNAITEATDKNGSKCQQKITKDLTKCQDRKLKEFNKCKKDALKNLGDVAEVEACVSSLSTNSKVAKACGKITTDLGKKCINKGVDLQQAFPNCGSTDPAVVSSCLEVPVECETCKALNKTDAIIVDCDAFDDGNVNGSCQFCGDGIVQPELGEQCEASQGSCCSPTTCQFISAGTECRGSAGICDLAESCTGSDAACPADGFVSSGTECRASAGVCDLAESCTGSDAACPADGFVSSGTECRASAGVCDLAESCTGSDAACPTDGFVSSGTECRASAGVCDPAESCTGSDAACPADGKSTAECRASAGACDVAEFCDGTNNDCPADVLVSVGTECRASAGVCDPAESCTGSDPACPADAFEPATTVCRPSTGQCDLTENCTGTDPDCPADAPVPDGTLCDDGDMCTINDQCQSGSCVGGPTCGDGTVQTMCGEECDDGGTVSGDGCDAVCIIEFCGDSVINNGPPGGSGEECDPPGMGNCPGSTDCGVSCQCEPIGAHKCVFDAGSTISIVTAALPLPPFSVTGSVDIDCGTVDAGTGKAPCTCSLQSLDPFAIVAIGTVCVDPGTAPCPAGEIDCDGGNALGTDLTSQHGSIGTCASQADCAALCTTHCGTTTALNPACEGYCLGGTNADTPCTDDSDCPGGNCPGKDTAPHGSPGARECQCSCSSTGLGSPSPAGSLLCAIGVEINVESTPLPDPCGNGDILIAVGETCVAMTTETATSVINDANFSTGATIPPSSPPAVLMGSGGDCASLVNSVTTGIEIVGFANFFDSTIGDLQASLVFGCQ